MNVASEEMMGMPKRSTFIEDSDDETVTQEMMEMLSFMEVSDDGTSDAGNLIITQKGPKAKKRRTHN
jgi:hypothetical protein